MKIYLLFKLYNLLSIISGEEDFWIFGYVFYIYYDWKSKIELLTVNDKYYGNWWIIAIDLNKIPIRIIENKIYQMFTYELSVQNVMFSNTI